jgi:hypothetical protein
MIGRRVEITSTGGIVYRGIVRSIKDADDLGELFELARRGDPAYRRLVYVVDRAAQVREVDDDYESPKLAR